MNEKQKEHKNNKIETICEECADLFSIYVTLKKKNRDEDDDNEM